MLQSTLIVLLICNLLSDLSAFEAPGIDFILDIDGSSIAVGHEHLCAIEQKHGVEIGGKMHCWGYNSHDRLNIPKNVRL